MLFTARIGRTGIHLIDPSKLARYLFRDGG